MTDNGQIIIYQSEDGQTHLEVKMENETVWLTQAQMCELYQTSRTNIVEHIKHIYEEGELDMETTCRNFRQVRKEGSRQVSRELPFYNLDMIISLGYRVKSLLPDAGKVSHDEAMEKATAEYRKWQNATLSPVEQAYLDTIKMIEKKGKKK